MLKENQTFQKLPQTKKCTKCQKDLPLERFAFLKSRNNYKACCKNCINSYRSERRRNNPGIWKHIERKARYRYKYGLTPEEVPKEGVCPICLKHKKLVVDHKHGKEGSYRGFICYNCNTLLGHIENTEKMKRVYEYINEKAQE